jgi:hypothetical protein
MPRGTGQIAESVNGGCAIADRAEAGSKCAGHFRVWKQQSASSTLHAAAQGAMTNRPLAARKLLMQQIDVRLV